MSSSFKSVRLLVLAAFAVGALQSPALKTQSNSIAKDLPRDLQHERVPLPDDQNAFTSWKKAADQFVEFNGKSFSNGKIPLLISGKSDLPKEEGLLELERWVADNKRASDLLEEGLARKKCQFPKSDAMAPIPFFKGFSDLNKLKVVEARLLASRGEYEKAAAALKTALHFGQIVAQGEGVFIHYLVGASFQRNALSGMHLLSCDRKVPEKVLLDLISTLNASEPSSAELVTALKLEVTDYFMESLNLDRIVADWRKNFGTNGAAFVFDNALIQPLKAALREDLLKTHPQPLNANLVTDFWWGYNRELIKNARSAWKDRKEKFYEKADQIRDQWLEEMEPIVKLIDDNEAISPDDLKKAQQLYARISNPVGKMVICMQTPVFSRGTVKLFQLRAECEAVKAILALRVFEKRHEVLPVELSDVVGKGILKTAPVDPFSEKPLCYSREKKIIWSVNENETDDKGSEGETSRWGGEDAVWTLEVKPAKE